MRPTATALSRQYAKLCDINDFRDQKMLAAMRSLIPEREIEQHIERKIWEYAMVMLFLEELGYLNDSSEILSVGAGDERVLFWLSDRAGRMIATDIYGQGSFSGNEAKASMLTDPAAHLPFPDYPWRKERLDVRWMDGRRLDFPDESLDAVFTVSSIEHFGSRQEIARSAAEIGRVLRPGGHAMIITEYLAHLHPLDRTLPYFAYRLANRGRRGPVASLRRQAALGEAFTRGELNRYLIRPSKLKLMQPLDLTLSAESWENLLTSHQDGTYSSLTGQKYPLILVRFSRSEFTSVCLPLVKPPR